MNTLDVLSDIAKTYRDISQFSLINFPQQRLVQNWLQPWGELEKAHFNYALSMQKKTGLPFWNSIMLYAFNNVDYSPALLKSALHHNPIDVLVQVDRQDMENGFLLSLEDNKRWAVNSKVIMTDGSSRHIPMIDFHIPASDNNIFVVHDVCQALGLTKGFLLMSGVSYHFIGINLITEEELMSLLVNALLFCPIVDGAWISHQLRERSCSLRIDKKNGCYTKVVKKW